MTGPLWGLAVAAMVFAAWYKLDGANFQLATLVLIAALLGLSEAWMSPGLGAVLGTLAYGVVFARERGRTAPMAAYRPEVEVAERPASAIAAQAGFAEGRRTPPTPDGPYYLGDTPEKTRLAVESTPGVPMTFEGRVLYEGGAPATGATIEIWHADGNGDYDVTGYNCRGHQFTDDAGRFRFETVRPFGYGLPSRSLAGKVDYRSAHMHVKIRARDREFTTQIWFPGDPRNASDIAQHRFADTNMVNVVAADGRETCRFDFVV